MTRTASWQNHHRKAVTQLHVLSTLLLTFMLVGIQIASAQGHTWDHLPTDGEISKAKEKYVAGLTFTWYVDSEDCSEKKGCTALEDSARMDCLLECDGIDYVPVDPNQPAITESKITEAQIVKAHDPKRAKLHGAEGMVEEVYAFLLYTRPETQVNRADRNAKQVVVYGIAQLENGPSDPWIFYDAGEFSTRAERDAKLISWFQSGGGPLVRGFPGEPESVAKWPCKEPKFFYPGMSLDGYFTGHPPLRFSREQMTADLVGALQRFITEGNKVETGVGLTDVHAAAKTFISTALPTGKEEALQNAARQLAREKQQADPNARLTPGDLFYLSLKVNNGNVRNALFTAHAALYRDGRGANKKFIEQENILTPLRDPEGYVDGEYKYKTPQGHERSINPRQGLSGDEQGVWYHFFGLTTLEFTDRYGSASYYAARLAIWGGALQSNYTDKVIKRGFPASKLGGALGSLAIALEDNVRTNMGKPPDIAKYCINYYALAAGSGLKEVMRLETLPNPFKDTGTPRNLPFNGDILRPTGVVIYKSPLSIIIQGVNGEWFSFDQRSGKVDGNTPLLYFEIFPEEDGTLGFLGAPFFNVASIQMTGAGDGLVTLGLYDRAAEASNVYEFDVHDGDQVLVEGLRATPLLNDVPLKESIQQKGGTLPAGLGSGNRLGLLLIIGCAGLLFLLVIVGLALFFGRRRQRSPRRAPVPAQAKREPATSCPSCGATVSPGARFCEQCGGLIAAAAPPPVRSGGRCLLIAGIGVLVLLCLLALAAAGLLYFTPAGRQMLGLAASPATTPIAATPVAVAGATTTGVPPVPTAAELPPATATFAPEPAPTQPPSGQEGTHATPTAPAPPPAAVPSPALTGKQRLDDHALFDDFSSGALGWSQRNNESAETGYENEQYFIRVKQATYWVMSKVPGEFPQTVIEFDAAVAPGSAGGMYGVICHYRDGDNYDFVAIDPETSSFSAGRLQGGDFQFLSSAANGATEQHSQYLTPALTASNHIQVGCYDDWLELVIGGHSEGVWPLDPPSASGSAALFVYGFKNLGANGYKTLFDDVAAGP